MTDDRAEFTANRDAGLVKRHEQRLARAREMGRPEECLAHRVLGITPHICLLTPGHEGDHVWTADREAEPQPGMVGGSGQPPRSDATYPMEGEPVTDMVIPPEAVPFVAQNVVNQLGDLWDVPVDKRQATNDAADQFVTRLFNASTKALVETATRLGRELGRREAAEEIAVALEAVPAEVYPEDVFPVDGTSVDCQSARVMRFAYPAAAHIAREIATEEPK